MQCCQCGVHLNKVIGLKFISFEGQLDPTMNTVQQSTVHQFCKSVLGLPTACNTIQSGGEDRLTDWSNHLALSTHKVPVTGPISTTLRVRGEILHCILVPCRDSHVSKYVTVSSPGCTGYQNSFSKLEDLKWSWPVMFKVNKLN